MKRLLLRTGAACQHLRGQSLVEYALILALVAIVLMVALTTLGGHAENAIGNISNEIGNAT